MAIFRVKSNFMLLTSDGSQVFFWVKSQIFELFHCVQTAAPQCRWKSMWQVLHCSVTMQKSLIVSPQVMNYMPLQVGRYSLDTQ